MPRLRRIPARRRLRSRRVVRHPELFCLHIARVNCDAFCGGVEKRNWPDAW